MLSLRILVFSHTAARIVYIDSCYVQLSYNDNDKTMAAGVIAERQTSNAKSQRGAEMSDLRFHIGDAAGLHLPFLHCPFPIFLSPSFCQQPPQDVFLIAS